MCVIIVVCSTDVVVACECAHVNTPLRGRWRCQTGATALMAAAGKGHTETVSALVAAGANLDAQTKVYSVPCVSVKRFAFLCAWVCEPCVRLWVRWFCVDVLFVRVWVCACIDFKKRKKN